MTHTHQTIDRQCAIETSQKMDDALKGVTKPGAVAQVLPIVGWYETAWLRPDILAGLTLWGILVPEAIALRGDGARTTAGWTLYSFGLPSCLCRTGNHSAGGLGSDLGLLNHDGGSSRAIPGIQPQRIGRITRPSGPHRRHHLPAVRAAAAGIHHRVHFSLGYDRVHFRAGDPYRCKPGAQDLWIAPRPRRDCLSTLASC